MIISKKEKFWEGGRKKGKRRKRKKKGKRIKREKCEKEGAFYLIDGYSLIPFPFIPIRTSFPPSFSSFLPLTPFFFSRGVKIIIITITIREKNREKKKFCMKERRNSVWKGRNERDERIPNVSLKRVTLVRKIEGRERKMERENWEEGWEKSQMNKSAMILFCYMLMFLNYSPHFLFIKAF